MSIRITCKCGDWFDRPDEEVGLMAICPACGRECVVPKGPDLDEILYISGEADPAVYSGKAIASLVIGLPFFLTCLSGIPAIWLGALALRDIDRSGGYLKGRGLAMAGRVLGIFGCLFTLVILWWPQTHAGEAARRAQCMNNLKQIGLALSNYENTYGTFPAAAITDKAGKPLLSWRVAILPFLEQQALYDQFHLDEPWDSPHNRALAEKMPMTYACPSDRTLKPGMTGYQVILGPNTAFTPDLQPLKLADFTDGPGATILVGESRRTVPWTKPEDLDIRMIDPLAWLDSHHPSRSHGFDVLFADGSVRFFSQSNNPEILRARLTRNGNEPLPHEF